MRTAAQSGLIVLLARLVDSAGVAIRPGDVAAMEYSIYRVDRDGHFRREPISEIALQLNVDNVLFDAPQLDHVWRVDGVGYNFRHEIDLGEKLVNPPAGSHIVVEYIVTPVRGAPTKVKFELGVMLDDRRRADSIDSESDIGAVGRAAGRSKAHVLARWPAGALE
jgi:hypothetical protein